MQVTGCVVRRGAAHVLIPITDSIAVGIGSGIARRVGVQTVPILPPVRHAVVVRIRVDVGLDRRAIIFALNLVVRRGIGIRKVAGDDFRRVHGRAGNTDRCCEVQHGSPAGGQGGDRPHAIRVGARAVIRYVVDDIGRNELIPHADSCGGVRAGVRDGERVKNTFARAVFGAGVVRQEFQREIGLRQGWQTDTLAVKGKVPSCQGPAFHCATGIHRDIDGGHQRSLEDGECSKSRRRAYLPEDVRGLRTARQDDLAVPRPGGGGQRGGHLEDPDRIRVATGVEGEVARNHQRTRGPVEAGGEGLRGDIASHCDSIYRSGGGVIIGRGQIDLGRA